MGKLSVWAGLMLVFAGAAAAGLFALEAAERALARPGGPTLADYGLLVLVTGLATLAGALPGLLVLWVFAPDDVVAAKTGRSAHAVHIMRTRLGFPTARDRRRKT
jgi:hypothetical protein